jgi:hypothetical protein
MKTTLLNLVEASPAWNWIATAIPGVRTMDH